MYPYVQDDAREERVKCLFTWRDVINLLIDI